MKRVLAFLIGALLLAGGVRADITSNLVAHWKLDETSGTSIADSSGNGYTGVSVNNTSTYTIVGKINNALNFNGATDAIAVGSGTSIGNGAAGLSMSGWVKINTSAHRCLSFVSTGTVSTTPRLAISWGRVTARKITASACIDAEPTQEITSVSEYVDASVWHHVCAVVDFAGDTMTLYYDGAAISTTGTPAFTGAAASATNPLSVNIGNNSLTNRFSGSLDDVRIYDRALSAADVAELYAYTGARFPYWYFNSSGCDPFKVFRTRQPLAILTTR